MPAGKNARLLGIPEGWACRAERRRWGLFPVGVGFFPLRNFPQGLRGFPHEVTKTATEHSTVRWWRSRL